MSKVERWIELEIKDTADSVGMWAIFSDGSRVDRLMVGHWYYGNDRKALEESGFQLVCYAKEGKRYEP